MNFEQIVRPYQTQDITPPKRILEEDQPPAEDTLVTFGKEPSGKTFLRKMFLFENFSVEEGSTNLVEVNRKETTKRVTNPTDAEQYVDVATVDQVTMRNKTNPNLYTDFQYHGIDQGNSTTEWPYHAIK